MKIRVSVVQIRLRAPFKFLSRCWCLTRYRILSVAAESTCSIAAATRGKVTSLLSFRLRHDAQCADKKLPHLTRNLTLRPLVDLMRMSCSATRPHKRLPLSRTREHLGRFEAFRDGCLPKARKCQKSASHADQRRFSLFFPHRTVSYSGLAAHPQRKSYQSINRKCALRTSGNVSCN